MPRDTFQRPLSVDSWPAVGNPGRYAREETCALQTTPRAKEPRQKKQPEWLLWNWTPQL